MRWKIHKCPGLDLWEAYFVDENRNGKLLLFRSWMKAMAYVLNRIRLEREQQEVWNG